MVIKGILTPCTFGFNLFSAEFLSKLSNSFLLSESWLQSGFLSSSLLKLKGRKQARKGFFGLQVRCRGLDIFKILGMFWELVWKTFRFFGGIFWKFFANLLEIFCEDFFWRKFFGGIFCGEIFCEDFFGRIFGRIFWEEFFRRNFLGGVIWEEFFV